MELVAAPDPESVVKMKERAEEELHPERRDTDTSLPESKKTSQKPYSTFALTILF